jgi:hypothetical protein
LTASGKWGDLGTRRHVMASAMVGSAVEDPVPQDNASAVTTAVEHQTRFYTLAPCRLIDTRDADGPRGGPALVAMQPRTFAIAGTCGVPASAWSVALNVTVVAPAAAGHLTLYPGGTPRPLASSLNFAAGVTRANNASMPLDDAGNMAVFSTHGAHVVFDVTGYYQ